MQCIVTAGPTWEPLDAVRRLTNLSTGRLGVRLADSLVRAGWTVTLFRGSGATHTAPSQAPDEEVFTTGADLAARLERRASREVDAVFHAAAVGDFVFGRCYQRGPGGRLLARRAGKLRSGAGPLLVELRPTPKIIARLRDWFPRALIVGWKYEVDGRRAGAVSRARAQIRQHRTDACVANGPAYGAGYGLITAAGPARHLPDAAALYAALGAMLRTRVRAAGAGSPGKGRRAAAPPRRSARVSARGGGAESGPARPVQQRTVRAKARDSR
jgi:hypothetical protein